MCNFKQLPMMASRLFLWGNENPKRYKQLFQKFKSYLLELTGLMGQRLTLMSDSGKYRIRFEFFCKTKNFLGDVHLPYFNLQDLILVCDHEKVGIHMMSEIRAIMAPLYDFYKHIQKCETGGIHGTRMWDQLGDELGPNRMTTLIFCLERAVQSLNIINNSQYGRITSKIWDILDSDGDNTTNYRDMFFAIPEKLLVEIKDENEIQENGMFLCNANIIKNQIDSNEESNTGGNDNAASREDEYEEAPDFLENEEDEADLTAEENTYHLLRNTLYSYKRMNLSHRLKESDLKTLPKHTQTLGGQMAKDSILPKGEEHLKAKVAQAFFEFSENNGRNRRSIRGRSRQRYKIPVFQKQNWRMGKYKNKSEAEIKSFFDQLCRILWDAYDISWYTAWKQRKWYRTKHEMNYSTSADMSLEKFPTTKKSFDEWHQKQIGPSSATLVQAPLDANWTSSTPVVTSSTALFTFCFKECDVSSKSKWNKMVSVRVFKLIAYRLDAVFVYLRKLLDHNTSTIHMWSISYFLEHLFTTMSSCRKRESSDNSKFLLWDLRSADKRYWSWQKIRPVLVMVPNDLNAAEMPFVPKIEQYLTAASTEVYDKPIKFMFPFDSDAEKRKAPGTSPLKDKFFELIKPPPDGKTVYRNQLNHIIALRTVLAFQDKLKQVKNVNPTTCATHLIFDDKNIQFGKVFGYSKKVFVDCIKNVKTRLNPINKEIVKIKQEEDAVDERGKSIDKKKKRPQTLIEQFARKNEAYWFCSEEGKLKIFVNEKDVEDAMKFFFDQRRISDALRIAHVGCITEYFLSKLIDMREKYYNMKGYDEARILSELGIRW